MVDWNALEKKWNQISEDLKKQLIDAMIQKYNENPGKFTDWLKEQPGRQIIWANYAAPKLMKTPPTVTVPKAPSPAVETKKAMETVKPPAAPTAAPPRPTRILGEEDRKLLLSYFAASIVRGLGRTVPRLNDIFNVEFQEVKLLPFQEAKDKILAAAEDVVADFMAATHAKAIIRGAEHERVPSVLHGVKPGRREEIPTEEERGIPTVTGERVIPTVWPSLPLSMLKFPRGPSSEEQERLWHLFCYQMQQEGFNCEPYSRDFAEYIWRSQFLSWEDLHKRYEFFMKTVMSGAALPPLSMWRQSLTVPTGLRGEIQELVPVEKLWALIAHYTKVQIINSRGGGELPTFQTLYDELVERAILPADFPFEKFKTDAIAALKIAASPEKWMLGTVTQEELDGFLAT